MTTGDGDNDLLSMIDKVPLLKILLSSAGVVGLLVAIGYIVDAAQENLFGIAISNARTTADYALLGGGFFVDNLRLVSEHSVIALILIALITVAAILTGRIGSRVAKRWPLGPWFAGVIVVVMLYAVKSIWLDVPYMRMSDLLSKPPICENVGLTPQEQWEHNTWERFICGRSRSDETLAKLLNGKKSVHCTDDFTWSAWQRSSKPLITAAYHSRLSIPQDYILNLFLSAVVMYGALLLYTTAPSAGLSSLATNALRVGLLALVGVNLIALPYVYGKMIRRTDMPSGRIVYTPLDEPQNVACLIIGADDKFVTFYDYESDQQKFVQIARSKVHQITIDSSDDLVAKRMIYFLSVSQCP